MKLVAAKKIGWAVLVAVFVVLISTAPSYADRGWHGGWHGGPHHGGHVRLGFGFVVPPVWLGPAWAPPYYGAPAVVVPSPPPVYTERDAPQGYWYYCQNPQGYYPYVQQCPGGWMSVVPPAP